LANYLGWRRLIDHAKTSLTPQAFLFAALGVSSDQQLTMT
ncbi:MAG: IS1595 family transposase, partial [Candidatus Polarisedimenticolaceae bacterium]|nr:IS1595 family transposase [Candidatus Polarisedimenticolaceae bacterium]MCF6282893.1 IS1595 family transposase [Candidatus Polarisedimenticolaceae bacterium]MCF6283421.1 IS1595 family transposase [Candidatus Polarisedimenticolaceae bacterium]